MEPRSCADTFLVVFLTRLEVLCGNFGEVNWSREKVPDKHEAAGAEVATGGAEG